MEEGGGILHGLTALLFFVWFEDTQPSLAQSDDSNKKTKTLTMDCLSHDELAHVLSFLPLNARYCARRTCSQFKACLPSHTVSDFKWFVSSRSLFRMAIEEGFELTQESHLTMVIMCDLDFLQWVHMCYPCEWDATCYAVAVLRNDVAILDWLLDKAPYDTRCFVNATHAGRADVLEWLKEHQFPCCSSAAYCAAELRRPHVVRWLHENGYPWESDVYEGALRSADMELAEYLYQHSCPRDEFVFSFAVVHCSVAQLEWLMERDFPYNDDLCVCAAKAGRLDTLRWAHGIGVPLTSSVTSTAAKNDHLDVLRWALAHECPYDVLMMTTATGSCRSWLERAGY